MADSIKDGRPVLELWWEENDLHIIYADNEEHIIYKSAYCTDYQSNTTSDFVTETELKIEPKELK